MRVALDFHSLRGLRVRLWVGLLLALLCWSTIVFFIRFGWILQSLFRDTLPLSNLQAG